jgi:hypothetical protein
VCQKPSLKIYPLGLDTSILPLFTLDTLTRMLPPGGTLHKERKMEKSHEGILKGFHSSWSLVQHGSEHHLRLHLANLRTARLVCQHIAEELDHLIKLAELKLAEHESLNRDVKGFQKNCTGQLARQ